MKLKLVGGEDIKKYTIADIVWNSISEVSGFPIDFEIVPIKDFVGLCRFYWDFLGDSDFIGFNIALPWKSEILKLIDSELLENTKFGAINVVYKNNSIINISNTDIIGIEKSLANVLEIEDKDILILGAGGAGLSTAKYLSEKYTCKVYLYDIRDIGSVSKNICLIRKFNDLKNNKYDIIINATPVGKYYFNQQPDNFSMPIGIEEFDEIIKKDTVIQEMNYFPHMSQFLKYGKKHNLRTISGIEMLIYQALESFKMYTGIELDKSAINRIFDNVLNISIKKEHELF